MKASVVICTYGRPEQAKKLLEELNKETYKDFEVLVVCQGDKHDLEEIENSVKASYFKKFYYEANPNLPHARNVGIKQAVGEIVIFLDDDIKPVGTLIEAHVANYSDAAVGMIGGRISEKKLGEDIPDSKIGMIRKLDGFAYSGFDKNVRREVMHVKGGNMSARRSVALEIGGFDEQFKGTAEYEEMDFCLRVLKKGYKIIFDPIPIIEHLSLSFGGCRIERREDQVYWLYRNHSLVFLKNFNKLFYPVLLAEYIVRIILRSLRWCDFKVIGSGVRGIRDGWKAYFSKPHQRSWE